MKTYSEMACFSPLAVRIVRMPCEGSIMFFRGGFFFARLKLVICCTGVQHTRVWVSLPSRAVCLGDMETCTTQHSPGPQLVRLRKQSKSERLSTRIFPTQNLLRCLRIYHSGPEPFSV